MTRLEQIHLLLRFHFAPDNEAKVPVWGELCPQYDYTDGDVHDLVTLIATERRSLSEYEVQLLRCVTDPPSDNDASVAAQVDAVAEGADVKWIAVNLLNEVGYPKTAAAISRHA